MFLLCFWLIGIYFLKAIKISFAWLQQSRMDEATTVPTRYEIGFNNSHSYDEYKTIRYWVAGLSDQLAVRA